MRWTRGDVLVVGLCGWIYITQPGYIIHQTWVDSQWRKGKSMCYSAGRRNSTRKEQKSFHNIQILSLVIGSSGSGC